MPSADLSIGHQNRRLSFTTLLLLPSSSMEFLRVKERLTYKFYPSTRPDTSSFLKAKHSTNRRIIAWENKGSQKTKATGERKGHHGRGSHHGPWCSLAEGVSFLSLHCVLVHLFGLRVFFLGSSDLGLLGLPCYSLDLAWLQISHFSP